MDINLNDSIHKPFELLSQIVDNRKENVKFVFAEYIYSLLYHKSREPTDIIKWIKENLMVHIHLIIQEIIEYISESNKIQDYPFPLDEKCDLEEYSAVMFDMCCQLDLDKTKEHLINTKFSMNFIYHKILELYEVKKELENYKLKYDYLRNYIQDMSNGHLYYEMNDDYQKYMNQIR